MLLVPGSRLDRYELVCPIAQGGMASVWLARMRGKAGFEKRFALKTILPEHAHDPRFQQMLLDEARIAARLVHTSVAQILDLGEAGGVLYIAMEWVEGDTLVRLARAVHGKQQRVPPGIALRIVADVCAGLHAAHEMRDDHGQLVGVVHRDVSPHNVIVSTQGVAKLIDFGIAKASGRAAEATSSGTLKGKVVFMAPEQASGGAVDRRADVWAIGSTLQFLLTGAGPFEGVTEVASLQRLMQGGPRAPLPPDVPRVVSEIVDRALVHDRDARAQTTAELHDAILRAMASDPRLAATSEDVAAFVDAHLGARIRERAATQAAAMARLDAQWEFDDTTSVDAVAPRMEEGATLGPSAIEAADDARRARTRVAVAAAIAAVVVGAVGAVVVVRSEDRSAIAPASAPVVVSAPAPSTSTAPVTSLPSPATSSSTSTPTATPTPTSTASSPVPASPKPAASAHRDYGF